MTDFSPAAQTVLDAYHQEAIDWGTSRHKRGLAAALEAAADQVVPEESKECECFTNEAIRLNQMGVRAELLAIAAELRGTNPTNRED